MAKSTIFFNEAFKKRVLNVAVSNLIAKRNIVNVFEVVRLVEISVIVEIVVIRNLGKMYSLILLLAVNVENLGVLKNIVSAFKTIKSVDLSVNARIAVMGSEFYRFLGERLGAYFNKPALIISARACLYH